MIREECDFISSSVGWELMCLQCEQPFCAHRRDAKYCPNGRCRQNAARRKKDLKRAANHAISQIRALQQLMQKYPDLEMVGALEFERIGNALSARTTAPISVTAAAVTDKTCAKCGKLTTVSPASGICIDCLRKAAGNS